jgi:hypothetical protein
MAARIPLGKALTSSANSASIQIRLSKPPYLFVCPSNGSNGSAWTGSVYIQMTEDSMPSPNNGGGVTNGGITDANADWKTIITLASGGDQTGWIYPLYRVRVLTSGITGGTPNVYMLEAPSEALAFAESD